VILGYSYAVTNNGSVPAATFQRALTDEAVADLFDPGGSPVFANPAATPGMPWKSDPSRAHLMGTIRSAGDTQTPSTARGSPSTGP
jgi:hypothetical protein